MIDKNSFFKNYFKNTNTFKKRKEQTRKLLKSIISNIKKSEIPVLDTFKKDYEFDFSNKEIKKFLKYENIIILGIGGSTLGARCIYSFFKKKIKKKVFFFDNLDLNLNEKYNNIKNLKNSCYVVISKSGNTLETIFNLGTIISKNLLKKKLIIITEISDNTLMSIANKYNAEIIEHKRFVGGRYSVLSETGMLPAALMGLDVIKFKNLFKFLKSKNFTETLIQNVSTIYSLQLKGINNSVIFSYDSDLNDLGYWYQQLIAESLGKKGKGINPNISIGPKDHHSLLQLYLDGPKDKFFTFFNSSNEKKNVKISNKLIPFNMKFLKNKNLKSIVDAQCEATMKIFKNKKISFRQFKFKKKEDELGEVFSFFVLETILLAKLMKINPFDQPAVEEVKIETKNYLS